MTDKHDFSDLTPPINLWDGTTQNQKDCIFAAARWGAEQAAERLKGQWPEPITDRRPAAQDADEYGLVQYQNTCGIWCSCAWGFVNSGCPWLHTPRWQPPAPPTLKEQALKEQVLKALGDWIQHNAGHRGKQTVTLNGLQVDLIRRALEADS